MLTLETPSTGEEATRNDGIRNSLGTRRDTTRNCDIRIVLDTTTRNDEIGMKHAIEKRSRWQCAGRLSTNSRARCFGLSSGYDLRLSERTSCRYFSPYPAPKYQLYGSSAPKCQLHESPAPKNQLHEIPTPKYHSRGLLRRNTSSTRFLHRNTSSTGLLKYQLYKTMLQNSLSPFQTQKLAK